MARRYELTTMRKVANRLLSILLRAGVKPGTTYLLTTTGQKTGKPRTTPVTLVEDDGWRWLVAPYGEVNWVRNVRRTGRATLTRGRRSEDVAVIELSPEDAAPILKTYVDRVPVTQPFFDAPPDAPVEEFVAEARRHPVFAIRESSSA